MDKRWKSKWRQVYHNLNTINKNIIDLYNNFILMSFIIKFGQS